MTKPTVKSVLENARAGRLGSDRMPIGHDQLTAQEQEQVKALALEDCKRLAVLTGDAEDNIMQRHYKRRKA